jgi:hypothetical protein
LYAPGAKRQGHQTDASLLNHGFTGEVKLVTDIGFIGLRRYDAAKNRPRLAPQGDETVQ